MKVGFIGIGSMGWPMAAHVAKAGHAVTVFDLDAARTASFVREHPADAAANIGEVGGEREIIITMLPTGADVRAVLMETDGGLAGHLGPGTLVVDMSSSEPVGTRELGAELADHDIVLIDAPVSGGVLGAEAATLTIMIGGENEDAIGRATPVLETMGGNLFRTGPLGSGHAMKALNNYVFAAGFTSAAEAMLVGEKFGLDPATMIDIINVSTGRNFNTEHSIKDHVLPGTFAFGFGLSLMAKDVGIAGDLAKQIGVDAPVATLIQDLWRDALAAEGADQDYTAAYRHWKKTR